MSDLIPGGYQVMPDIDAETFAALKADIAKRGVITPIDVDENGSILDGHNRYRAWQELGKNEAPPTIIRAGLSEDEKFAFARKQNLLRRHLTREQKQALISEQILRTPNRSDRSIAADLACDHKTVGAARKRLNEGGEIPQSGAPAPQSGSGRPGDDTPESFTRRALGSKAAVTANAARVAALPADLKLTFFEAGISAGSVIVGHIKPTSAPDPETEKKWERWTGFLLQLGWVEEAAADHTDWIRRGSASPDEWLTGEDARAFRRTLKLVEPSDKFIDEWLAYKAGGAT
jgi:hypothetical protein